MLKKFIVLAAMLVAIIPAFSAQYIPVPVTPCRTFEEQRAAVAAARPDVTIAQPMDEYGVVIYHQPEEGGDIYVANNFNSDGCLTGVIVLSEKEYKEYLGISI